MSASQQTITLVELSPLLEILNKKVEKLGSESEKLQQSWKYLSDAVKGSQTGVTGWALGLTGMGRSIQSVGRTFSNSLEVGFLNSKKLEVQLASTVAKLGQLATLKQAIAAAPAAGGPALDAQNRQLGAINAQMAVLAARSEKLKSIVPYYQAQNEFLEKLKSVNIKFVALEGFLAGVGLKKALEYNRQLNESLIYSNSAYSKRQALMTEILKVQGMTGNSTQDMAAAVKTLSAFGLETDKNFGSILRTSVLLEEGLGLTYETSAQLAEVWERQLGASFKGAGDLIARVVNQTGLASAKAAEFATNLGRAFANVGMTGNGINAAVERVVRLEGFINKHGGKAGEISKLVAKMQTMGGVAQAAQLGINQPGQLAGDAGAKQAVDALARQTRAVMQRTQAGTVDRMAQMEDLATRYETSTETLIALTKAVDDNNKATDQTFGLEERWRDQVANTGKGMDKLLGSLQTLLHQGFLPYLKIINWVSSGMASLIGAISKYRLTAYAAVTAVGVAMVVAGYKAVSLAKDLILLVGALHLAATKARQAAVATALSNSAGYLPGLGPSSPAGGGGIGRVFQSISDWNARMGRQGARMAGEGATRLEIFRSTAAAMARSAAPSSLWQSTKAGAVSLLRMPVGFATAGAGSTAAGATGAGSLFGTAGAVTVGGIATVAAAVLGAAAVGVGIGLLINKYVIGTYDKPKPIPESASMKLERANHLALHAAIKTGDAGAVAAAFDTIKKSTDYLAKEPWRQTWLMRDYIQLTEEQLDVKAGQMQRDSILGVGNEKSEELQEFSMALGQIVAEKDRAHKDAVEKLTLLREQKKIEQKRLDEVAAAQQHAMMFYSAPYAPWGWAASMGQNR